MLEARQPDPDQAHRVLLNVRLLKRRTGGAEDRLDVVGRARPAHLAAHEPEIRELELHVDRPRADTIRAQAVDNAVGEVAQRGFQLATIADVFFKSGFRRDRLGRPAAVHRRAVATLRVTLQDGAADPERLHQSLGLVQGQLADCAHAHRVKPFLRLGTQARNDADRHRGEKVRLGPRWYEHEPVGLAGAARDLRHQLGGRCADGRGQLNLGVDLELDPPRHLLRGRRAVTGAGGDVEVGLVERYPFDQLWRSEEHTSELQSLAYLVCRLL